MRTCLCLAILLLLIFKASAEANFCISNDEDSSSTCDGANVTVTFEELSTLLNTPSSDDTVSIYLTHGTHLLTEAITFEIWMTDIVIQGSINMTTVIYCVNGSGFIFTQRKKAVEISDIVFEKCDIQNENASFPTILYFDKIQFIRLVNIVVANSSGYGLYALNCNKQTIERCTFIGNKKANAAIKFEYYIKVNVSVVIKKTRFYSGSSQEYDFPGGLKISIPSHNVSSVIQISSCFFIRNKGGHLVIAVETGEVSRTLVDISNTTFSDCDALSNFNAYGIVIESKCKTLMEVSIQYSSIINNKARGLHIGYVSSVSVSHCSFSNNAGIGMYIIQNSDINERSVQVFIANTSFLNNARALHLELMVHGHDHYLNTTISSCTFFHHTIPTTLSTSTTRAVVQIDGSTEDKHHEEQYFNNVVTIENVIFWNGYDINSDCSSLHIVDMDNITLKNTIFKENSCTGLSLIASAIQIEGHLNFTGNRGIHGGAIHLESRGITTQRTVYSKFSKLVFKPHSQLHVHNNTALTRGGGIRTDETCDYRNRERFCFFQFDKIPRSIRIYFSGNSAQVGGDSIFGGCLTNCTLYSKYGNATVDVRDPVNIFWSFALTDFSSQSTIAANPSRVAFCSSTNIFINGTMCTDAQTVHAYRGQNINVSLMVADDFCVPSTDSIQASIDNTANSVKILRGEKYESRKYCTSYTYSIGGDLSETLVTVELASQTRFKNASLNVRFTECPLGFEIVNYQCTCNTQLKHYKILCTEDNTLKVPPLVWIGEDKGKTAVSNNCQFCNAEEMLVRNLTRDANKLCTNGRTGLLCGSCLEEFSLLLGSMRCGNCSSTIFGDFSGNGVVLSVFIVMLFSVAGIILILVLFFLNITVSSGVINALIFYCNLIYSNSDTFLPADENQELLHGTMRFLSAFLAWVNLDSGIATCFFDRYNTYISVWMQFFFPLYIWLLVLLIVVASRLSKTVSRLTTSNTVPVLATLLLLSYAKLFTTCIDVISVTRLYVLDDSTQRPVWILDGNIDYLRGKHVPLFLMGVLTTVLYLLPFTLLVLLGPILQAKSEKKIFKWINKMKPLLDAFYGPYTSGYRYWPGLLLLARSTLFIATVYSLGHKIFMLSSIAALSTTLLAIWLLLGKTTKTSIYASRAKNYLELYFLVNLTTFSIASAYFWSQEKLLKQQILAAVMVGSVFVVFCAIIIYCTVSKYKCSRTALVHMYSRFQHLVKKRTPALPESCDSQTTSATFTQTTVELADMGKLREPLLDPN